MKPQTALVLFSHGSLLCGSGRTLDAHATRLRQSGAYVAVEPGYLNYSVPPVEDAIRRCLKAGATTIIIVPYFLVAGKFVIEDLPRRLRSLTPLFPGVDLAMGRALEDCGEMLSAIEQVVQTAEDPKQWQRNAIEQARNQCELRTSCPLYGSPMCRFQSAGA